jgi:uncharacterized membrane protein
MALAVSLIAFAVLAGMVVLRPGEAPHIDSVAFGFVDEVIPAEVVSVVDGPCSYAAELSCELVVFSDGTDAISQEFPDEAGQPHFETGDPVYLSATVAEDGSVAVNYYDRDRGWLLVVIGLVFAAAVIGLGRMRGVAALLGLAISLGILLWFIVPAIVAGRDAMLVALVGGGAIVLISLYLAHGFTPLTHVAAIGAFAALALSTGLSWIVTRAASFTGLGDDEAYYLLTLPDIDLSGLLLAGIVLGAIGALDDVTVTQASAVWEVAQANPNLEERAYFDSGLRIGRDHIASTVNTLLLAYAGAAMPLLILYSLSGLSLQAIASSEVVGVEIVRTLVGSLGLVASVPMTTWLAARQVSKSSGSQPAT